MLGWFKNKFSKKDKDAEKPVPEQSADADAPEAELPFVDQETEEVSVVPGPESDDELPEDETTAPFSDASISDGFIEELVDKEEGTTVEADAFVEERLDTEVDNVLENPGRETADEEEILSAREESDEIPAAEEQTPDADLTGIIEEAETFETAADEELKVEEAAAPPLSHPQLKPSAAEKPEKKKKSFFSKLSERLARTRESFTYQLDTLFLGKKEIDAELLDDLEELLITADLGVATTQEVLDHARRKLKRNELSDPNSLKLILKDKIKSLIIDYQQDAELVMPAEGPFVIMVVGVNGVGKTTTIGKIAHKFRQSGQSVLLVAADTFRAAAISQLKIWGERNNISVIAGKEGTDPSSVVYDGIAHARAKDYDVVLVDTAGRLHTQANLMEELKKIKRVMSKKLPGAPHEVMLIVDATTGQNGISQAKLFNEAVELTGITLTKLDGTAKGGIVANICKELQTPIRFIGIGEQLDDLRDFDPDEFVEALFQSSDSVGK